MTCREIQEKMPGFVKDQMSLKEAEGFIDHVKGCHECMEELEVNYVLYSALQQLEDDTDFNGNYMEELHRKISQTEQKIRWKYRYGSQIKATLFLAVAGLLFVLNLPAMEHWLWTKQVPEFRYNIISPLLNYIPDTDMPGHIYELRVNAEDNRRRYEAALAEEKRLEEQERYFEKLKQRFLEEEIQRKVKENLEKHRLEMLLLENGVPSHNTRAGKWIEYTQ